MKRLAVVAGLALVVGLGSCGKRELEGRDFVSHCVVALEKKIQSDPAWIGAEPSLAEPLLVREGPPHLVKCAARLSDGRYHVFDVMARCSSGYQSHCSSLATPEEIRGPVG